MNKDNQLNDQATQLRQMVQGVSETETSIDEQERDDKELETDTDILNLPPRKEVHRRKKQSTRLKIGHPLQRLLFIILLLVVIIVGAYFFIGEELLSGTLF
ncbi:MULTISPECIES: hypothetical protein [Clostridia]|uniref:hypothetical protein n=1 Tax=Clostridia TaxID=186801 RepID=UPI000EA253DA|nr:MULTISPECIES: hypothetical protein [Clostridia]NBJ70466.1 hypothetical protein [Roseburia sp. 1XD42-34]RKI76121.1 hypothetical protein D7V87_14030 [Clostridium sp. 1xD42-85]